jgi:hypothetical protein
VVGVAPGSRSGAVGEHAAAVAGDERSALRRRRYAGHAAEVDYLAGRPEHPGQFGVAAEPSDGLDAHRAGPAELPGADAGRQGGEVDGDGDPG